jgi:hypothetical protein
MVSSALASWSLIDSGFLAISCLLLLWPIRFDRLRSQCPEGCELFGPLDMQCCRLCAHHFRNGTGKNTCCDLGLIAASRFGCVLAIRRGISHIWQPQDFTHIAWNYAVLAIASLPNLIQGRISCRELLARKDRTWDEIIGSRDPTASPFFWRPRGGYVLGLVDHGPRQLGGARGNLRVRAFRFRQFWRFRA